jgi:glyoxylase-like metal-dependent hydrolase (beta-lactamase superfamily II)
MQHQSGCPPSHLPISTEQNRAHADPGPRRTYLAYLIDQPLDRIGVAGLLAGARVAGYGTPAGMRWTGPPPRGGLADGQSLPGAADWTVINAGGHTDDSIALWNPSTRTLLSGDAVLTVRGKVWHTPEIVDAASAAATRKRLEELPVAHLLPGHGRPVHGAGTVWPQHRR